MKSSFKVLWGELSAVALFVSHDEIRYCLNGVFFDVQAHGRVIMVATDGRRIAMVRSSVAGPDSAPFSFIMPREALGRLVRLAEPFDDSSRVERPLSEDTITVSYDTDTKTIELKAKGDDFTVTGTALDADFPNYLQIIPREPVSPQPFIFINPDFFNDYLKAARMLGREGLIFQCHNHNEDKTSAFPVIVTIPNAPQFFSICMTIREGAPASVPLWLCKKEKSAPNSPAQ